ncbi:hypothetical protein RDWZM_001881 [Blomia tropicalis]|uniref:Vacuolar-sorting protein SNF8 n=1 Tax=Blomia tropicalis TaxID=40697 RepID=A0A9Q0MCH0_BLOTA|nr:ESCRT-II subunit protein snf8 [Blomia tropicalis]KAJ6223336.1 hypothetical protein RDWZM_001881 [Blomia tropicalis]
MRRRGLGVGAIHRQQQTEAKYKEKSAEIAKEQLTKLSQQMEVFREKLQEFAIKHKKDIRKDPNFRRAFQTMCANVGVDPLHSSSNFWTKMLGVGDIYYELAVQVIEICIALNHQTGGVMPIDELYSRLIRSRKASSKSEADIAIDDIVRAIEKISALGSGIQVIKCKDTYLVYSLSREVDLDQNEVIKLAQEYDGRITAIQLIDKLKWSINKSEKVLNNLTMEGIVWVDVPKPEADKIYWFPGLFKRI